MENDKLTEILIQIALLNEKIDTLILNNSNLSRKIMKIEDNHTKLVSDFENHKYTCPMNEKVNKLESELLEYKMIKKYSKLLPYVFITSVFISLLMIYKWFVMK